MKLVLTVAAPLVALALACGPAATKNGTTTPDTKTTEETTPMNDDPAHRWDLKDLFASDAAWDEGYTKVEGRLDSIAKCKGTLGSGAATLADCLDNFFDVQKEVIRLLSYAHQRADEDTSDATALAMKQRAYSLATQLSQKSSFMNPELLALGAAPIAEFLAAEPRLAVYNFYLNDIVRRAAHTLDDQGEAILAATGMMSDSASTIYGILTNSDIPWPTVTLSDGTEARLDPAGYTQWRGAANRADRKLVFDTFYAKYKEYEQTLGMTMSANLKKDVFYAQVRKYDNCLAQSISSENIPEAVYRTLIKAANDNLDTLHRYFKLRGRMLGIDDLAYYDIYPPLVTTDLEFPIEVGKELVVASLDPLGADYKATVDKGFKNRWMDVYPRKGKRSGAYSSGSVYGVHPYVLMNYTGDYEAVTTLAHEFGHAMHSYLANATQPLPTADYGTFIAEVASTFNEALLLDHVLENAKSDEERLYYLGSALEGLRGTFYRQTMFAEFELAVHERAEKHEALTGKVLTEIYADIVRRYHGHDKGVLTVDDAYTIEWAYIPHFYYGFYVYKYATSVAASSLFAKDVLAGKAGASDRFLSVLKAGGSQYPYEMLKSAGVDLATAAPYDALVARMNTIMDKIEAILDKQAK